MDRRRVAGLPTDQYIAIAQSLPEVVFASSPLETDSQMKREYSRSSDHQSQKSSSIFDRFDRSVPVSLCDRNGNDRQTNDVMRGDVSYHRYTNTWRSNLVYQSPSSSSHRRHQHCLGYYKTKGEAEKVFMSAIEKWSTARRNGANIVIDSEINTLSNPNRAARRSSSNNNAKQTVTKTRTTSPGKRYIQVENCDHLRNESVNMISKSDSKRQQSDTVLHRKRSYTYHDSISVSDSNDSGTHRSTRYKRKRTERSNTKNKSAPRKKNPSSSSSSSSLRTQAARNPYRGVVWSALANKWVAQIYYDRTTHYLGSFVTSAEAAKVIMIVAWLRGCVCVGVCVIIVPFDYMRVFK